MALVQFPGTQSGAVQLPPDDDEETLDLLTKTEGGRAAVAHQKKIDELTHAAAG